MIINFPAQNQSKYSPWAHITHTRKKNCDHFGKECLLQIKIDLHSCYGSSKPDNIWLGFWSCEAPIPPQHLQLLYHYYSVFWSHTTCNDHLELGLCVFKLLLYILLTPLYIALYSTCLWIFMLWISITLDVMHVPPWYGLPVLCSSIFTKSSVIIIPSWAGFLELFVAISSTPDVVVIPQWLSRLDYVVTQPPRQMPQY
jgi:hypothetical protein